MVGWLAVFCFDWQLKEAAELTGKESAEEDQLTESKPLAAHEAPMMPPIVECVKETGNS